MTTVSIIIPAYNQARYLPLAIDTAVGQTYPHVEVIVVDDGSTDETPAICNRYGSAIRYIRKTNAGLPAARNTGILAATGEFLIFLDSDDYLPFDLVEQHLATAAIQPEADVIHGTYYYVDAEGTPFGPQFDPRVEEDGFHQYLLGNLFPPHAGMTRKTAFANVGLFDIHLKSVEDWDMWIRLAASGCRFARTEQAAVPYRQYPQSMSRNYDRMRRAALQVLKKAELHHPGCRKCRRNIANGRWNTRRSFLGHIRNQPMLTLNAAARFRNYLTQLSPALLHDPLIPAVRLRDAMRWVKWTAFHRLHAMKP